ncbi:MAG: shikimate dehydrogenase [Halanaerobiaceae bacterium]
MNKFGFIIHPLKIGDFTRKFDWIEKIPENILKKATKFIPPFKVSHITGIRSRTGKEIEGYFIACPLTSEQILNLPQKVVLNKIIKAGEKAEELGCDIVGLGSFTSVVGDKGLTVGRELDIPVTTGNSYTVATAITGTGLAARKMGLSLQKVTVIGAYGSIGRATSLMLAGESKKLVLVGRDEKKLQTVKKEIEDEGYDLKITITTELKQAVQNAEIIITASGAVKSLIDPEDLKPGAVVCDVARPRDVAEKVGEKRDDVLVIEGGVVEVPGSVNFNFDFGFPPGTAYACMAETMLLALEGKFEDYSLGPRIELSRVREIAELAKKHGFKLSGLRSFNRAVRNEIIEQIKEKAEEKMAASFS